MTHIDPFAPGDSPQHPANWVQETADRVQNWLADIYQWRRDHFATASEVDADIPEEELAARHERFDEYFDEYATDDERDEQAGFVSFPELLRRAVFADLDGEEIDEWKALFEQHSTEDERDPMWVRGTLPDLPELRARAQVADPPIAAQTSAPVLEEVPEEVPAVPKGNALKEEWVEYALAVDKARGGTLTPMLADGMTVADLKAAYKPQAQG